jgi:hypothetical protein
MVLSLLGAFVQNALGQVPPPPELFGITKVTVLVSVNGRECQPTLSEDRLRTVVEFRLRSAGIRVLTEAEDRADPVINPYVSLRVMCMRATNASGTSIGYVLGTRLSMRVYQRVVLNGAFAPSILWEDSYLDITALEAMDQQAERTVGMLLDQMLNEWLKANPRHQ